MSVHPADVDDITNSPAYHFLDELASSGKLSQSAYACRAPAGLARGAPSAAPALTPADARRPRVTMYKSKYASLHDHVVGAYDREKQLLKKAKTLHQDLLAERISSEKLSIRRVEDAQLVSDLQKEKDKAERELQAAQEKEGEAKWESEKAHVRRPDPPSPVPVFPLADPGLWPCCGVWLGCRKRSAASRPTSTR